MCILPVYKYIINAFIISRILYKDIIYFLLRIKIFKFESCFDFSFRFSCTLEFRFFVVNNTFYGAYILD